MLQRGVPVFISRAYGQSGRPGKMSWSRSLISVIATPLIQTRSRVLQLLLCIVGACQLCMEAWTRPVPCYLKMWGSKEPLVLYHTSLRHFKVHQCWGFPKLEIIHRFQKLCPLSCEDVTFAKGTMGMRKKSSSSPFTFQLCNYFNEYFWLLWENYVIN